MSYQSHIIAHPSLGCSIRGKASATSVQFRNLKYASIPARYKDSIPNNALIVGQEGTFDATQFGPSCPHKRGAQAFDMTLYGKDVNLPFEEGQGASEKMDEFECLHVNITTPRAAFEARRGSTKGLHVYVWIYGGGLSIGSNSWPQYDLRKFVERSVEIRKPVIAVAVNYRTGLFGFAAAKELGAAGNMGFKDQVLAFQWVKRHIAGFGGDPENITAAGESAGGISLSTLLCADLGTKGLFKRVVIMSGDTTLRKPRNTWWHEQVYKDQAQLLGMQTTEKSGLRVKLLKTDAEQLAQQLPLAAHYCGHIDGTWTKEDPTLSVLSNGQSNIHKPEWCKEYIIGDTAHDGTVLKARILDNPRVLQRLQIACSKYLTNAETQRLLAAYSLVADTSSEQARDMLRCLASELRFHLPVLAAHRGWRTTSPPKCASRYHFHVTNPFEGDYKGLSSHELDVAFLLQNFNDQLDERNRSIAEGMADRFIGFIDGEGWADKGKLVVFGPDGVVEVAEEEYDRLYRDGRGKLFESIGVEKLWKVAEYWQGVRSEDEENNVPAKL